MIVVHVIPSYDKQVDETCGVKDRKYHKDRRL